MSYRKKHIKNKIHGIRSGRSARKSIFGKLWFWIVVLVIIFVSVCVYFALFYNGIQLKNVVISGNDKVKTQELQDIVFKDASTGLINFWDTNIFSKSIFLVDDDKIKKDILQKFPVIEEITVNKNMPQTLILGVVERKPIGAYCPSAGSGQADNKCFLIDNNGIIFEPLAITPPDTTIVRQTTESGQIFTGEEVIAQNMITAIGEIQKSLKDNFQINVKEALITTPVRLNIKTDKNWQIYFDLDVGSDINPQLTKLSLLLNGGIPASDMKNLRYIDLRPKDRAIFCDNSTCGG